MTGDPLMPHLMDIVARPELGDLILAGGFGVRVKQEHLVQTEARTLISPFPLARATNDLDLFVRMEIFSDSNRRDDTRRVIDDLGYEVTNRNWQFHKPLGENLPGRKVKIDLLSRSPNGGESVKLRPPRVGDGSLHGRDTAEAFAIDLGPIPVPVRGRTTSGVEIQGRVLVPHPYAWLNMKVRAAYDWLRMDKGEPPRKPYSEKHAFDVYTITAMLLEYELEQCREFSLAFANHELAISIRAEAQELFSSPASPALRQVRNQTGGNLDFDAFNEGLRQALGY